MVHGGASVVVMGIFLQPTCSDLHWCLVPKCQLRRPARLLIADAVSGYISWESPDSSAGAWAARLEALTGPEPEACEILQDIRKRAGSFTNQDAATNGSRSVACARNDSNPSPSALLRYTVPLSLKPLKASFDTGSIFELVIPKVRQWAPWAVLVESV